MTKNLTPTVVVRRPVDEIEQVTLFSKRKPYVEFDATKAKQVRAGAKSIVAVSSEGVVELYVEYPHTTFIITYSGLSTTHPTPKDHVKEGAIIGTANGVFRMTVRRLPDYSAVEPEFYSEDEINLHVLDKEPPPPDQNMW